MKNRVLFLMCLIFLLFLNGCEQSEYNLKAEWCYPNAGDQQLFTSALNKAKVNYTSSESDGCYYIDFNDHEKVKGVQEAVFGKQPPVGLSISGGAKDTLKMVEKLNKHGIKTNKVTYHGMEFIVWEEKDADQAESLLELLPEQLDHMHKMRKETKSALNK